MIKNLIQQYPEFMYIMSQIFAFFAICFAVISYFMLKREKLFLLQTIGNLSLMLSFLFLGRIFACIATIIATIRTGTFSLYGFKNREVPWTLVAVFVIATLISIIFSYNSPIDILYFIGLIMFTCVLKIKNINKMKTGLMFANIIYIIYDFVSYNFTSASLHIMEVTVIIISLYRKQKTRNNV